MLEIHPFPKTWSREKVLATPLLTLSAAGILNPFGPTLSAVVLAGRKRNGARLKVLSLILHPVEDEFHEVGEVVHGQWEAESLVRASFRWITGDCPSLLLPSSVLKPEQVVPLHAELLQQFPGARSLGASIRKFPGRPWDRVWADLKSAIEKTITGDWQDESDEKPLNRQEALELARMLLDPAFLEAELRAFFEMWNGAPWNACSFAPGMATFFPGEFYEVFQRLARTLRLPPQV